MTKHFLISLTDAELAVLRRVWEIAHDDSNTNEEIENEIAALPSDDRAYVRDSIATKLAEAAEFRED